eukprot:TRINITY_DN5152_c0_g1_i1.p1 TRINITY_DN5152_c0_g1~~TRINITY_DN5152_c0_g1_i1.p1  ORF type:complete len:1025 (+),score=192.06 TRINITY_DN5152_c0_g1_i1:95-3169(+)
MGCSAWSRISERLSRLSDRPADSDTDAERKRVIIPICIGLIIAGVLLSQASRSSRVSSAFGADLWAVGILIAVIASAVGLLCTLASDLPSSAVASAVVLLVCVGILVGDLDQSASMQLRAWPAVIVWVQVALLLSVRAVVQGAALLIAAIFLAAERAEAAGRFGFYDAAAFGQDYQLPSACDCSSPPCEIHPARAVAQAVCCVALLGSGLLLAGHFTARIQKQAAALETIIIVIEQVADLLAHYSIGEAEDVIASDGADLPQLLRESLLRGLAHLKTFREYLPDSVFVEEEDYDNSRRLEPPGFGCASSNVALCFTDIESSTALWEAYPQGMYEALDIHNRLMRHVAKATDGYEVKTIGDAFMLAFAAARNACHFALEAQLGLVEQQWPPDLIEHPLCRPLEVAQGRNTVLLWNGLRVRVGVNCGEVRVLKNPITGRLDYFGGPVNVAARVEGAVTVGGIVGVTDAVLDALRPADLQQLGSPTVIPLGSRELKGVRKTVNLSVMLPAQLALRVAHLGRSLVLPTSDSKRTAHVGVVAEKPSDVAPGSKRDGVHRTPEKCTPITVETSPDGMAIQRCSVRTTSTTPTYASETYHPVCTLPGALPAITLSAASEDAAGASHKTFQPAQSPAAPPRRCRSRAVLTQKDSTLDALTSGRLHSFRSLPSKGSATRTIRSHCALDQDLRSAPATCATVRTPLRQFASGILVSEHLGAIEAAADRSAGVVAAVLSASVVVTWNASKPCSEHVGGCHAFLMGVQRDARALICHTGIATGMVHRGNVASGRRRFPLTVGGCVHLAAALSEEAELCDDAALAVGPIVNVCKASQHGSAHRAQVWYVRNAREPIVVWELRSSTAYCADRTASSGWEDLLMAMPDPQCSPQARGAKADLLGSEVFARVFERVAGLPRAEQLAALNELGADGGFDSALTHLMQRAQRGALRVRTVPPLSEEADEVAHHYPLVSTAEHSPLNLAGVPSWESVTSRATTCATRPSTVTPRSTDHHYSPLASDFTRERGFVPPPELLQPV